jgi:hypothetical protein
MNKVSDIVILGKHYKIEYVDKPSDVDIFKRDSLWGQVDFWTRSIRVFDNKNPDGDITHILLHEILHAIVTELHIDTVKNASDYEDIVDLISLALSEILINNSEFTKMFLQEDTK